MFSTIGTLGAVGHKRAAARSRQRAFVPTVSSDNWASGITFGSVGGFMATVNNSLYLPTSNSVIEYDITDPTINNVLISSGLSTPSSCLVIEGNLYVSNAGNGQIGKYSVADGVGVDNWCTISGAALNQMDSDETNIYVSSNAGYIYKIPLATGTAAIFSTLGSACSGLVITANTIYTCCESTGIVYLINLLNGSTLSSFSMTGCRGIATNGKELYITTSNTHDVGLYDMEGNKWDLHFVNVSTGGFGCGVFNGYLYVSVIGSSSIFQVQLNTTVYPSNVLNWTATLTGTSWSSGYMDCSPTSGLIYVPIGPTLVATVNLSTGAIVNASFLTGLSTPAACLVIGSNLYVSQTGTGVITKYDLSGNLISGWTCSAPGCSTMASDGTYIYCISETLYKLLRVNVSDGTCVNWSTGITGLTSITYYGGKLYVSISTGVISQVNLTTALLTTVVSAPVSTKSFVFSNGYMYCTTSTSVVYSVNMTTLNILPYTNVANSGWGGMVYNGYLYAFNRINSTTNFICKIQCH